MMKRVKIGVSDSHGKYNADYSLIICYVYTGKGDRGMSPFLKLENQLKLSKVIYS